ncbi:MAG: arsenate reductase ArsC [Candidatus Glassbacteria bacterium]
MSDKLKILFLCYGNACRSQMAEGWARHLKGDLIEPSSAGILASGLSRRTVRAMAEAGVDISGQESKTVYEVQDCRFDYLVTLCSAAHEICPPLACRPRVLHVPFDDPYTLCAWVTDEAEELEIFRRVRDEIREFVERLPEALES